MSTKTETRFNEVREALLNAGARRLWEATTEHDAPQRIIAYTGPGGVVLVHDYGASPGGEDLGVEIYTNGCEKTLPATIEFALEWLELKDSPRED